MSSSKIDPPEPLLALGGAGWSVWPWTSLRAPGFPASLVLRLASAELARASEEVLVAEEALAQARGALFDVLRIEPAQDADEQLAGVRRARKALAKSKAPKSEDVPATAQKEAAIFTTALARTAGARERLLAAFADRRRQDSQALREIAAMPRFREAIAWQNRAALGSGLDALLRTAPDEDARSQHRQHEDLVASYLQRYCTKNDSIGFFGPIGWGRFERSGAALVAKAGPDLLASRSVHFEHWPIDALARKLGEDARLHPWMIPRRFPFVRVAGTTATSPVNGRHELTRERLLVLGACDGRATAKEVASRLASLHPELLGTASDVYEELRQLREAQLIAWAFEIPLMWDSDRALRGLLERIDDEGLREEALRPLLALEAARSRVAEAAGDAARLAASLVELENLFTDLTGAAATRRAGVTYAARQLVFEDCRRDLSLALGPELLAGLAPSLSLVLASARWVTFEVGKAYRALFRTLYEELARRGGSPSVPFSDFWLRSQRLLFGLKDKPVAAVIGELQARWARILSVPAGAREASVNGRDIAERVHEAFAAPRPGWNVARYHSPDIMIAASSVEAANRGDYRVVLGEVHVASNTLDVCSFFSQHPQPEMLTAMFARDIPEPFIRPVNPKDWPGATARTMQAFISPSTSFLESGFDPARGPRERVLATGDLVLEDVAGELSVRTPEGHRIELMEIYGDLLSKLVASEFRIFPRGEHSPRVTIDKLVVSRENWSFPAASLAFVDEADDAARFLGARRWARAQGIPRFVYVRTPLEAKPVFVDFDAPIFVRRLAKLVRRAKEQIGTEKPITMSEMLPSLEQTWLEDAGGALYTSELRIICVDTGGEP